MVVPEHMEITASLMAGYRFVDGSLIEVDNSGDFRITDATGDVLADTTASGEFGLTSGAGWEDYGEVVDDLAAFLRHDADLWESIRDDEEVPEPDEWLFSTEAAIWAHRHEDELSELACYREDKRLEDVR